MAFSAQEVVTEQPLKEALWRGQHIVYYSGRLSISLAPGVWPKTAYEYLIKAGCTILWETVHCRTFQVATSDRDTLRLAVLLGTNPMFRYVEPQILDRENFN